jgi:hypothetical protein
MYILIVLFIVVIGYIPAIILYYYIKSYISYKIGLYRLEKKYGSMSNKNQRYKFSPVSFKDVLRCFSNKREDKYHYLGISWNIFNENTNLHDYLEDFIVFVAKKAKPWWCPTFVLNLLHLFANDNSIVRCRDLHLASAFTHITGGLFIRDIKVKYGTIRVYGSFTKEVADELTKLENLIDPHLEAY